MRDLAATAIVAAVAVAIYVSLHHPPANRWQAFGDTCLGFGLAIVAAAAVYLLLFRKPVALKPEAARA